MDGKQNEGRKGPRDLHFRYRDNPGNVDAVILNDSRIVDIVDVIEFSFNFRNIFSSF